MSVQANALRLSTASPDFDMQLQARLQWSSATDDAIEQRVSNILHDVRLRGDEAVLDYTRQFDHLNAASIAELAWSSEQLKAAYMGLPYAQRDALTLAANRIRSYHEVQKQHTGQSWQYRDSQGNLLGQKVTPIDRVGIYVPGGKAAYPSSVLMNAIPAHVAGVAEIVMVVPTPMAKPIHWFWPPLMCLESPRLTASAGHRPLLLWLGARTASPKLTKLLDPEMPM